MSSISSWDNSSTDVDLIIAANIRSNIKHDNLDDTDSDCSLEYNWLGIRLSDMLRKQEETLKSIVNSTDNIELRSAVGAQMNVLQRMCKIKKINKTELGLPWLTAMAATSTTHSTALCKVIATAGCSVVRNRSEESVSDSTIASLICNSAPKSAVRRLVNQLCKGTSSGASTTIVNRPRRVSIADPVPFKKYTFPYIDTTNSDYGVMPSPGSRFGLSCESMFCSTPYGSVDSQKDLTSFPRKSCIKSCAAVSFSTTESTQ